VLGHLVSARGIEVDKAKVDVIAKLPPPENVKGIQSFLGHAGFYRRFIKNFSHLAKPLTNLLNHEVKFVFVTTQDFINFWGKFFVFVLLEMIGISQGFKTFEFI
jgi:hypothetical protein